MSETRRHLHALSDDEADVVGLRQQALTQFMRRYQCPESRRAMLGSLHRLATVFSDGRYDERTFPWELLSDEELAGAVWHKVAERYSHNTAAKDASALRLMLKSCHRLGLLTYEEYRHACSFEAKGGTHLPPPGHYLSEADLGAIVVSCLQGTGGVHTRIRDAALVMTLASTGARREEIHQVRFEDVDLSERRIWLSKTKSGTPRNAWLHPEAVHALENWFRVRGSQPGPMFGPLSRVRRLDKDDQLSTHQMWKIVTRRSAQAGHPGVTPHDLRRFAITTMLDHGIDIALVARTVGHTKTETTARYDRRPATQQRDAVSKIQLPSMRGLTTDTR